MTSEEFERAAKCAAFMGWKKNGPPDNPNPLWCLMTKAGGVINYMVSVSAYNPAANTPQGREQANELWRELESRDMQCDIESWTNPDRIVFKICIIKCRFRHWYIKGEGPTWNAVLVNAVAKLEVEG